MLCVSCDSTRLDQVSVRVCGFMVEPKMSTTTWSVARWISVIRRAWSGRRLGSRGTVFGFLTSLRLELDRS